MPDPRDFKRTDYVEVLMGLFFLGSAIFTAYSAALWIADAIVLMG